MEVPRKWIRLHIRNYSLKDMVDRKKKKVVGKVKTKQNGRINLEATNAQREKIIGGKLIGERWHV